MVRLPLVAALAFGFVAASALAGEDPVETRQNLMKSNSAASKVAGAMAKGETEFDPAQAELAMRTIFASAAATPHYFPEGTEQGAEGIETRALPAIWENMDDFNSRALGLETDAWAAIEAAQQGQEAFAPAFAAVSENCGGCHEAYRGPEQ